ncbi:mannose-6-phosphate isomerase, class I [Glutamicibacter protophormiae]|uniref:mannose-6-phosphate isomerase n=1 Tax=Glutamicibacter protophormiae TaxID=37930 RepID=A0ABS4XQ96_GLUPR|nr:mannose-6-phosphate isomerase, class I [Glutamicibacter protophormiae]MBP2398691.1 mannose-6-phosphate isomerase [Glutamicibacter protophormiae]GGL81647.1 mannose-6-phosphate isomerase [Glutamicibacter protophormiae]
MFELNNTIRDYHWGSDSQISDLLGLEDTKGPQAELWLGAHPGCPSRLAGNGQGLDAVIAGDPAATLGTDVAERYGRLPFLFKVLSAAQPLSIQVHPTLQQARERFALENAAGKALDAADRNYRDDNHKPEMLYALTEFTALSGFRRPEEILADLELLGGALPDEARAAVAELAGLLRGEEPLAAALEFVLTRPGGISAVVQQICSAIQADPSLGGREHFSELVNINGIYPGDAGVLVALLLNLVFLAPGQAISLAAGNVHAYLRGLGIEVMANSDNVLRGGLTSKHIDVPELLDVTIAQASAPPLLTPQALSGSSLLYQPEFDEFQLQVISGAGDSLPQPLALHGAGILLCTEGEFAIRGTQGEQLLRRGDSVFLSAAELPATAACLSPGSGRLFAASAQRI